ncbi:hypothetical protein [Haloferax sp. KTX1]|uniref:hypothetical protein n=1 Tax=Haloferax sp. KTX1 TaxID=2600597 RepID=UPI0011DDF9EA|nr:hypothetical protein [Haloferax sp. KTX1]
MELTSNRRSTAGLLALCCGLLSTMVAVEVVGGYLSLEGMPVVYGLLGLSAVGTLASKWFSRTASWKSVLLYGALTFGSSILLFLYLFSLTDA